MTYDELVTAVSDYSENTFPTSVMNTMIKQAEQRIYNTVQIANLRKNVTGSLTSGNKYLQCPVDFLSVYSLAIVKADGSYEYLLDKDVNFIRQAYPNPATTGVPKYYAIFGPRSDDDTELTFILGPTPSASLSTELHYFAYPESIVTAGQTWLGDNFDSALFNGVMIEAVTYMKGEADMVKLYSDKFMAALTLLKNLGDGKQRTDAYRTGQTRARVL